MTANPYPFLPSQWAQCYGQDDYGFWQGIYVKDVELRLRWIPPGEFMMGSPEDEPGRWVAEGPQHEVRISEGFWLAETACSQVLWQAVAGNNPSGSVQHPDHPVENVDWKEAKAWIESLNQFTGLDFHLPSEAQWEYACRAGATTPFSFGSELTPEQANYDSNYPYNNDHKEEYRGKTLPVKYFQPNPWGLYQMHGNVWEWCEDVWHDRYDGAPADGQPWRTGGDASNHVVRGGSWFNHGRYLRSAYRYGWRISDEDCSFRLALGPMSSSQQGQQQE